MKEEKELYAIIRKRHTFLSYNEKKLFEKNRNYWKYGTGGKADGQK